jgi:glycosyltransferase involved in cell wall biosynthesis
MKCSVIIPSNQDPLLKNTINSVLEKSFGEVEVIVVLDGITESILEDPRVKVISLKENRGMRGAINAGLEVATGDFVMKSDSHCVFASGFDKTLSESCQDNWLMIPRRYSLEEATLDRNMGRPMYDYHYYSYPIEGSYGLDLCVIPCRHHTQARKYDPKYVIDDTMIFQGSCWFANRKYFMDHVGLLDDRKETYGTFAGDQAEIGLKYWLNSGEIKVNKNTWYAHLIKVRHHYLNGTYTKAFKKNSRTVAQHTYTTKHWMNNEEPGMIHPFSWLIEKFWPVPTWPEEYIK